MKKWINILFNILVFAMLIFSIVNGFYLTLDPEIQDKYFSWYNQTYAYINAVWAGLGGLGGGALLGFMTKVKNESDDRYITLKNDYNLMASEFRLIKQETIELKNTNAELLKATKHNNELLTANLEAKLDNKLIEKETKLIIEQALGRGDSDEKEE